MLRLSFRVLLTLTSLAGYRPSFRASFQIPSSLFGRSLDADPGSRVRIGLNASYSAILLQLFLPFLPGVFCELMPSHFVEKAASNKSRNSEPKAEPKAEPKPEPKAKVRAGPRWTSRAAAASSASSASLSEVPAGRTRVEHPEGGLHRSAMDAVLPPDEFRLNNAADFLPASESDAALGALWGGNNKLAGVAEIDDGVGSFVHDLWSDAVSGRALAFYCIPKVRFVFVNLLYLLCECGPTPHALLPTIRHLERPWKCRRCRRNLHLLS